MSGNKFIVILITLLIIVQITVYHCSVAQIKPMFTLEECILLYKSDSFLMQKEYDSSIKYIHKLHQVNSTLTNYKQLYLNLYYCYRENNLDSAFYYFSTVLKYGWQSPDITTNILPEEYLIFDEERNKYLQYLFFNNSTSSKRDSTLIETIGNLIFYDQIVRGRNTNKNLIVNVDSLKKQWDEIDSINLIRVKEIIYKYGWPGYIVLGKMGDIDLWALVQHADNDISFQKKVLKLIEAQVLENNTRMTNYAYLYDRICVNEGYPQLFGTQAKYADSNRFELEPLQDSKNVNYYRLVFGLESIEEYIDYFKSKVRYQH